MGIRNPKKEILERLESKTLEAQFKTELVAGLNCSPFEAEAVLAVVKEVYFPFITATAGLAPPGKVTLVAVCADEPPGKPIAQCVKRTICLTVHQGPADDHLLQAQGPTVFRRSRLLELCQEALSQGALLTREDLAYRIFFVAPRTISRDLAHWRQTNPAQLIPLRSTVQDMGPVLTHRVAIVRLALQGKTTSEICRLTHHSAGAVSNYLATFTRCYQLQQQRLQVSQIAFLLGRSPGLVQRYLELISQCRADQTLQYHLNELLRIGAAGEKKSRPVRQVVHD